MRSPADTISLNFRDIEEISEIRAVEDLQIEAWGDDTRDIVPLNQLVAARHVGGTLVGAFDGPVLAGFVYGFYGHLGRRIVHHSHMLAVHPVYRNQDLAFRLKLAQRERVLADDLTDRITWTFDPLQSVNAHFNFAKLGVIADTYKANVYGDAGGSFLHRNGTDRFFVTWLLESRRVTHRIESKPRTRRDLDNSCQNMIPIIRCVGSRGPERNPSFGQLVEAESALVEIPADINAIEVSDFGTASEWRFATRQVFLKMLEVGFIVTDFLRKDERTGVYLLERKRVGDFSVE